MGKQIDSIHYTKQLLDIIVKEDILYFHDLVIWCRNNDYVLFSFLVNSFRFFKIFIDSRRIYRRLHDYTNQCR